MARNIIPASTYGEISHPVADLAERAADYARNARSPATLKAYSADLRDFEAWCAGVGFRPLPAAPQTVALYLTHLAGVAQRKASTIGRRLVAIGQAHKVAGHPLDLKHREIREVLAGIRRTIGTRREPKAALLTADIRRAVAAMPDDIAGIRDRALLLLLFAGALRRSELVALEVADVQLSSRRATVTIRRSKTDQEGEGARIGIPRGRRETCPVRALENWLAAAAITRGPIFRSIDRHSRIGEALSGAAVAAIVKRAVARIGLDPRQFSGHSGRSGFITQAAANGADIGAIGLHARQKSLATTRSYVQEAAALNNPAAKAIRL
jgi:site-specific recombinase XerD